MPNIEQFDPGLERAHSRMDDIERRMLKFNNPAPTVPQYDLRAPTSLKAFSATTPDDGGYNIYVGESIGIHSPLYIECDFIIPQSTFDAGVASSIFHTAYPFAISDSDITSYSGGGFEGATLTPRTPTSSWSTGYNPGSSIPVSFDPTIIHKQTLVYNSPNIAITVDDIYSFGSYFLPFTPSTFFFGAINPEFIANQTYYITLIKIGSTSGGSDIFSSDFSSIGSWSYSYNLPSIAIVDYTVDMSGHYTIL